MKLLDQFTIKKFDNFSDLLSSYSSLFQKLKNYESELIDKQKLLLNSRKLGQYHIFWNYNKLFKEIRKCRPLH